MLKLPSASLLLRTWQPAVLGTAGEKTSHPYSPVSWLFLSLFLPLGALRMHRFWRMPWFEVTVARICVLILSVLSLIKSSEVKAEGYKPVLVFCFFFNPNWRLELSWEISKLPLSWPHSQMFYINWFQAQPEHNSC